MVALASLIVVVLISLLITRVATVALTLTGLSREAARFQARSALSGVGFTTSEAESVVTHPVRRRVVMLLMLFGSAGVVTVVGTLVLSFANTEPTQRSLRLAILVCALILVWVLARSAWVDRHMSRLIAKGLDRWTSLDARDYAALLHVGGDYAVIELAIDERSQLAGKELRDLALRDQGVLLLGIARRAGDYEGVPRFDATLTPGDTAILYGRADRLRGLSQSSDSPAGDPSAGAAVAIHHRRDDHQEARSSK